MAAGLTLAGAQAVVLAQAAPLVPGIPGPITADQVAAGLLAHPEVRGVLLANPGRFGVVGELAAIATLCRAQNIPLLVDEARGAHFHFHPALPPSGCAVGADVVVQSGHKTLSGLAQTGWLQLNGELVDRSRVRKLLQMLQSSSPSYVLMASLDAARRQVASRGTEQLAEALALAADLRLRIATLPGLAVVALPGHDQTQVVLDVRGLGVSGQDAARRLREGHHVSVADASDRHVVLSVTGGNTSAECDRLVAALTQLSAP